MLKAIQEFFRQEIEAEGSNGHDTHSLQLATAALLFEMTRADFDENDPAEHRALESALQQTFSLSAAETTRLAELAEAEVAESVSLHQFTELINKHFSVQEKVMVVEMLWQVAFADGELHRYEEGLVRKVAELLYVPHRDFIRARHRVEDRRQ